METLLSRECRIEMCLFCSKTSYYKLGATHLYLNWQKYLQDKEIMILCLPTPGLHKRWSISPQYILVCKNIHTLNE